MFICFVEIKGESFGLFKKYCLNWGFINYLLDGNGVIIVKNIFVVEFFVYVNKIKG